MTAPLPTPDDVAAMRALIDRARYEYGATDDLHRGLADAADRLLALVDSLQGRLAAVLAECDAADAKALASTARTFDGQPFPACIDVYRIRRAAAGEGT